MATASEIRRTLDLVSQVDRANARINNAGLGSARRLVENNPDLPPLLASGNEADFIRNTALGRSLGYSASIDAAIRQSGKASRSVFRHHSPHEAMGLGSSTAGILNRQTNEALQTLQSALEPTGLRAIGALNQEAQPVGSVISMLSNSSAKGPINNWRGRGLTAGYPIPRWSRADHGPIFPSLGDHLKALTNGQTAIDPRHLTSTAKALSARDTASIVRAGRVAEQATRNLGGLSQRELAEIRALAELLAHPPASDTPEAERTDTGRRDSKRSSALQCMLAELALESFPLVISGELEVVVYCLSILIIAYQYAPELGKYLPAPDHLI